jgi:hypothetical protein
MPYPRKLNFSADSRRLQVKSSPGLPSLGRIDDRQTLPDIVVGSTPAEGLKRGLDLSEVSRL